MSDMTVAGASNAVAGQDYAAALKKAAKDYQDKMLTGLTEDERKEIEAKLRAYREKCVEAGMNAKEIQTAVDAYYKELLREYGAKFDNEFEKTIDSLMDGSTTPKVQESGVSEKSDTVAEIRTESDGTVFLIITSPNGINMKIKIGSKEDGQAEATGDSQKGKDNGVMNFYENNIDAYFQEENKMSLTS